MLVQQRLPYYSLGYWIKEMRDGHVFTLFNSDLSKCLEKYLPLILCDFPLPLAIAVPALHPKIKRIRLQIIRGGDFFESLLKFYRSELYVRADQFCWPSSYNKTLPKNLTWNTSPDKVREKIFHTGIYVTELLPLEDEYFTCAQIEQLSKIDFCF